MLKKHLFISFLISYIIVLRADEAPFELGLFQELIYKYSSYGCWHTCWDMYHDGLCGIEPYVRGGSCDGQLIACEELGQAIICAETDGQRKIRYVDTMQDQLIIVYGSGHPYCSGNGLSLYAPKGENATHHHRHCNCRCFKDYFRIYLGEMRSRENDNYVIVGLRLKLHDDVLYLQIGEGILEGNGVISEFTWLPPPYNPSHYHYVDLDFRNFFFDDLTLDPGYVLTGVKFEFMEIEEPEVINGFGISISGVPFDYVTGKLDLEPVNRRIVKANSLTPRKELKYKLVNPVNEIASPLNRPSPAEYNYVKLQQSELEIDFGQTTLPLFDGRSFMISPLTPLAGIGILHNGTENHAGFISLRLYPIY